MQTSDNDDSLTKQLVIWWQTLRIMAGDIFGLAASETKLAAVSLVQLLIGVLFVVSLLTLAMVCLQIMLGFLLYTASVPILLILFLLFILNTIFAFIVYHVLKPIHSNFEFKHTRNILMRPQNSNPVTEMGNPQR